MAIRAVLAGLILAASVATTPPPALNQESFAQWRDYIRPTAEETRWQSIPWRTTFWDGVTQAQKEAKPILVWAMNGHPLACT
jgi:hypothetical protein